MKKYAPLMSKVSLGLTWLHAITSILYTLSGDQALAGIYLACSGAWAFSTYLWSTL